MSTGAGIDVLAIGDITALSAKPWFLAWTFTPAELAHADGLAATRREEYLAGRFAVKEAVAKLLRTGFSNGVTPAQIEVGRDGGGGPTVTLHEVARTRALGLGIAEITVSIAHKDAIVVALAVSPADQDIGQAAAGTRIHEITAELAAEAQRRREGTTAGPSARVRVRVGQECVHYGGALVDGAFVLRLFGDLMTEIAIRTDGVEGLLSRYEDVRFLAPVRPGDYLEAEARVTAMTALRREVVLEARKVIAARYDRGESCAEVLAEPALVAQATGTIVVPYQAARRDRGGRP
jgi:phosphopantetheine--protein transferase-like protein